MFSDLIGSTALSVQLDPEDLRAVLLEYYREVSAQVERFGGFVARRVGDGVLIYFGYPTAHEDDAERAIKAGLALIDALHKLRPRPEITLDARVGIESGLVVLEMVNEDAAQGWSAVGETPNFAARVQSFAEPGTVVIGPVTHRLAGDRFVCLDLGARDMKGIASPVRIWQALHPVDIADRSSRTFNTQIQVIGRVEELDLLLRRWEQAKTGDTRVVLISGEPGIGKSRLTRAFEERIGNEPHAALYYYCSALHQDSVLFPIIGQIEQAAKISSQDDAQVRVGKLLSLLQSFSPNPPQDVALLADLLGIDAPGYAVPQVAPAIRMEKTLEIFLTQLIQAAARQPVLVIFEDAHWIDASSHVAIQCLIERLQTLPILLIVTGRPEFQPQWGDQPHVSFQPLNRLGRRERELMIEQLTNRKPLPAQVTRQIVELTDGVPLFVEELTKTVVESELLREESGRHVLRSSSGQLDIPITLQASLLARLDRLGSSVREIAQEASVIGRDFDHELLASISRFSEAELTRGLEQLVASGLVHQRGQPPLFSYSFRHALIQEVAYSTLVRARREALHERTAKAYEHASPDMVDTRPELLAHHLGHAREAERAISLWLKAARISSVRGAAAEAVAQLNRGLALLDEIPDAEQRRREELELQIALGGALLAANGYAGEETGAAFARARELCRGETDAAQSIRVIWGQFTGHFAGGRQRQALPLAKDLLALSERIADPGGRLMGHVSVGASLLHSGHSFDAREQFERGLAIDFRERDSVHLYGQSGRVAALAYMGLALLLLDSPDAARLLSEQAISEAVELEHPTSVCFAHSIASRVSYLSGDRNALARHSAMVVRLGQEHGLLLWQALGTIYAGWSQVGDEAASNGAAMMRDGVAKYRATGGGLSLSLYLASLAEQERSVGKHQLALDLLKQAQQVSADGDEHWMSPELHRLAGEIIASSTGNLAAAEVELERALALARQLGITLWEKRANASLHALRSSDGVKLA